MGWTQKTCRGSRSRDDSEWHESDCMSGQWMRLICSQLFHSIHQRSEKGAKISVLTSGPSISGPIPDIGLKSGDPGRMIPGFLYYPLPYSYLFILSIDEDRSVDLTHCTLENVSHTNNYCHGSSIYLCLSIVRLCACPFSNPLYLSQSDLQTQLLHCSAFTLLSIILIAFPSRWSQ